MNLLDIIPSTTAKRFVLISVYIIDWRETTNEQLISV